MLGDRGSALGYFFIGQVGKERAADAEQVDAFMGIEFLVLNGKKSVDDVLVDVFQADIVASIV